MLIVCELADHNKSTHVLPATLLPSDLQSQTKQVGTLKLDTVFFFTSGPSPHPANVVYHFNSPNLAHQHWEGKEPKQCSYNID